MFPIVVRADAEILGPTADSTAGLDTPLTSTAATGAAQSIDTGITMGAFMIAIQCIGAVAYLRFSSTATTATTSTNGVLLPDSSVTGEVKYFWITPRRRYLDIIQASGTIKWWQSSPNAENSIPGRAR